MKRMAIFAVAVMALVLAAGAKQSFAQSTIKIPNEFKVGGASLPKGDYTVVKKDDTHLTLRQETTGKETTVAFTGRLAQPNPPLADPQLVFDVVGDFARGNPEIHQSASPMDKKVRGDPYDPHRHSRKM
jgi:hypothetical protein